MNVQIDLTCHNTIEWNLLELRKGADRRLFQILAVKALLVVIDDASASFSPLACQCFRLTLALTGEELKAISGLGDPIFRRLRLQSL